MKERGLPKALAQTAYDQPTEEARTIYKRFNFDLSRELWPWIKVL